MLLSLRIENFALIDQLEIEFGTGLNVLTGETGAGKSIILDAIDVVLGGKVSSRLLRTGSQRALVEATFSLTESLAHWLKEQEIELLEEETLVCSREMSAKLAHFRSRSRINGVLVNRKIVQQLRDRLVEITAQGQTVELLVAQRQRDLLDLYGGVALQRSREEVKAAYEAYKATQQALEQRRQSEQERLQRLDWLNYQLQELEGAELNDPDELTELEQERDRLSHVVDLQNLSYQVYQLLYQNDQEGVAVADLLAEVDNHLQAMVSYDGQLTPVLEMVQGAIAQVIEAGQQINHYGDRLEADPQRLEEVGERIQTLKQICRKYGPELSHAIAHRDHLQNELAQLTTAEQSLEHLTARYEAAEATLIRLCALLTQKRQQAAQDLENQLIRELKPLAMEKVRFECRLTPTHPTSQGMDQVTYYFSPNPGEPLQPLSSTASGGEMSRFLLALKACFSQTASETSQKTLIFDEIDAGVSGKVAQAIAEKLHQLSRPHQILCVTHQPLIAALADHHFRVDKQVIEQQETHPDTIPNTLRTVVRITSLDHSDSRTAELAQLTGGDSAGEAIAFAQSLLAQAAARLDKRG
ncbi:DNA repair protein RecN [Spirulina subsalsa]|uniref:DNA repair protein RecN n=1 Tax=Spirulina subsalsa TaxID=54311 RepID=UPI0002E8A700|nr:DNA repair protein RecN [Spirulina subsalsa]